MDIPSTHFGVLKSVTFSHKKNQVYYCMNEWFYIIDIVCILFINKMSQKISMPILNKPYKCITNLYII